MSGVLKSGTAAAGPDPKLRILTELSRGNGPALVLVGVLAVLSTAATLALPMVVGKLLAAIQNDEDLALWATVMVGVGFGSAAAGALAAFLLGRMGQELIYRLRVRTMDHALGLRLADAQREGGGNLTARITADAARVKSLIDIGPIQLPMAGVTVIGTLVIMGLLDWVLLLITVGAFLIAVGVITVVIKGLRRKYADLQDELGGMAQNFVSAMESLTVIKAYRAERRTSRALAGRARKLADLEIEAAKMESLMVPVINLGQQIALVAVVVGGGARMLDGHLTLADFVAFLLYLLQLTAPLIMAASGVSGLQTGLVARKRFEDVFALPTEDVEAPAPENAAPLRNAPAVRFENVTFGYGDDRPVLRGADLTVPARGLTAMVGLSGSGKSTSLALIERFVEPESGRVSVYGRDVAEWPLGELRGQIGYVDQSNTLLQDSVRGNLTLGRDESRPADDEELYAALESVGLAEEIRSLPEGLDTVLGGADNLSGGQRQRLALARATLSDTRLVLLDEPSSHLDSINEQRLRNVVDSLAADRAVLVVAHRISTIQHADHVIVMDAGRVVDQGDHDALLRRCPAYAELVSGQVLSASAPAPAPAPALA
ncbi:ABC transporter ATP-binding protein [Streptomyces syringium]|uniref:ABC transporter ATP-binding protein n=1 Tax=Streptomyces syringium TaxID=76729 RepID=UPI00343DF26F